MRTHSAAEFQKNFRYYEGSLHLVASGILAGLSLQPTEYSPVLQKNYQGNFTYQQVKEYSSKWLKKTKDGLPKDQRYHGSFEPSQAWTEDRWIFVRRLAGYELCQKLFYQMCAFIWCASGIGTGPEIRNDQDVLIEEVFGYGDKMECIKKRETIHRSIDLGWTLSRIYVV